jgi:hypothetical protein
MMNLGIPAVAICALRGAHGRRRRWVATVSIIVIACGAAANISRTGLAMCGLLAMASLAILWWPSRVHRGWGGRLATLAAVGSSLLLMLVALLAVRPAVMERFDRMDERWSTYFPRYLQAKAAVELINRSPAFGHGPGAYRLLASDTLLRGMYLAPRYRPGQPYTPTLTVMNDYLQFMVEWGVVGCVAWGVLLMGGLAAGTRAFFATPHQHRREIALVACSLVAVFGHALLDSPLQVPALLFMGSASVGLLWAAPVWRPRQIDPTSDHSV